MFTRTIINRIIILSFMGIVGFSIANAIYSRSLLGILLACLSLSAGIYFLHLLEKAKQERETEEAN